MALGKKICLLGDFAVGKTSLLHCFEGQQFFDEYQATVGVEISSQSLKGTRFGWESEPIQLIIWDLEGYGKFGSPNTTPLQGASGALVVGALDRPVSLDNLKQSIQQFLEIAPERPVAVALNKADLLDRGRQQVLLERYGKELSSICIDCQLTSAKTGENVDTLFERLICSCLERCKAEPSKPHKERQPK